MRGVTFRGCLCVMVAGMLAAALLPFGVRVQAQALTIEGVWGLTVTLRNCATNAPLGAPFRTIFTFHQGGTISESPANPGLAPGQRTPGHGVWTHAGPATYSSKLLAAIVFDTPPNPPASPGFLTGWQTGTQTAVLSDPDHLTTTGQIQFYDLNRVLYRTVCASSSGERLK